MNNNFIRSYFVVGLILVLIGMSIIPGISGNLFTNWSDKSLQIISNDAYTSIENSESFMITVQEYEDITSLSYQIQDFQMEKITIEDVDYYKLLLDEESNIPEKNCPDLPNICRSIIIPDDAKMEVQITDAVYQDYENILIAPFRAGMSRNSNPADFPFEFSNVYKVDGWYPGNIVELNDPYILRDFRAQLVKINPFQYNPITKILRVYSDITIDVYPIGSDEINVFNRQGPLTAIDKDFRLIYERHLLNFNMDRYSPVEEQGNMLVITYDDFWDEMVPFVEWKNMKGIPTEMVNKSDVGTTASQIDAYIENYYNINGLTFVLLVGDIDQMPSMQAYIYYGMSASDPSYSYIVGDDHYPDLFVGRFSAETPAHVATQVERSIEYEKYPQSGAEWYHKGTGVASNQGAGQGDEGESDDQHMDNIRDDLLGYTYSEVDQIYDPTASATQVSNAFNDGRSIANYCGHGTITSWSSSGFSNYHINNLVNDNMLPFICSVACSNGEFDYQYGDCFAETWLRATNNNEPTGAIAVFMASNSQFWASPMDAEDEIIDILIETYADNRKTTYGGLCFNGCMHMNDEYPLPTGNYDSGSDMTDTWHIFGDPSLQVRTDSPTDLTVIHESYIPLGVTNFEITVTGVEDALCAISRDYTLLGYAYTDGSGYALIEFDEPISPGDDLDLVVTAYNTQTYITNLPVIGDNLPPEIPESPEGSSNGRPYIEYFFQTNTTDPDGDQVQYGWDWNNDLVVDEWTDFYDSGDRISTGHSWINTGLYDVRVKAKDTWFETDWSDPITIDIYNNQPMTPSTPIGPETGGMYQEYSYLTDSSDPDGDLMFFKWDWGDGSFSDWLGPYTSGESVYTSHAWNEFGTYNVKVKTKDAYDFESGWSEVLSVIIAETFIRGDIDADNNLGMEDALNLLRYLYIPGSLVLPCMDAGDVNDDGEVSMNDALYLLRHLYAPGSPQPPAPYPDCNVDPTEDELGCLCYPPGGWC